MSEDYGFVEEDFYTQFNGQIVLRILKQTKPYWYVVLGFVFNIALVATLDGQFTLISKNIIDVGIIGKDPEALRGLVIQYGVLIVIQALTVFGFIAMTGWLGHRVRFDVRKKVFDHLQALSLSYYDRTPVGWIISRMTSDVDRMAELVTWGLLDISWGVFGVVVSLIYMFTINWQLAILGLIMVPFIGYAALFFRRRILVHFREARKTNSRMTGAYNEMITGVRVVKAMRREEHNLEEFKGLTTTMHHASYRAAWYSALFLPTVQFISSVTIGGIVSLSGAQVTSGALSVGGIYAFVSYITFMMWPIQEMARVFAEMQLAIASSERIFSLLDTAPDIVNKDEASDPGTIKGDIVFDNVSFFYEENKPVFKDFSLTVKQGDTIALVGATGAGKSTIVNLICRFYEPTRGRITINGMDYTDMTLHAIHSRIGMVLQTPHLFSGTIKDNIRYGRLSATDEEVVEAAKVAGAHEFIEELDNTYDEQVGEGGVLLSVGQKQLISIARAILADPEIFIMDEATSSVDTLTEALIQQGMEKIMTDRTSFVIAHRLSTIKRADRILVIEAGEVIEQGTHAELLRLGGHYHNLYTRQFRSEHEKSIEEMIDSVEAQAAK